MATLTSQILTVYNKTKVESDLLGNPFILFILGEEFA